MKEIMLCGFHHPENAEMSVQWRAILTLFSATPHVRFLIWHVQLSFFKVHTHLYFCISRYSALPPPPQFWEDTFETFIPNITVKHQNFFMFRMCWISPDDQLTRLQFFSVLPNKFWGSKSKYATKAFMSSQFTVHSSFLWLKIRFYIPPLQKLINFHLQLIETMEDSSP